MSTKSLFTLWGGLFILCAGLGFVQPVTGVFKGVLFMLSLAFFLPPAFILRSGSPRSRAVVRNLSGLSLGLTVALLLLTFLTALRSEGLGIFLHCLLTIVSAPMICSGYWVVSLFLWACLLSASIKKRHGK